MNDSKNLILAVVLSALVLLGWTWAANKYFPTANPPSTKVESGKQQPLPQPQAQPRRRPTPKALQTRLGGARLEPARQHPHAVAAGSINLKGAQIDDLLLLNQRADDRQEFAAGAAAVAARRAGRLYRRSSAGRRRARRRPALDTVWTADSQPLTPGHPVTLTTQTPDGTRYQIKIAVDDGYLFTVQQSVTNASGKPLAVRPIGLVSRASQVGRPVDLDRTMSARSACSTARPITTSTGRTSTRASSRDVRQRHAAGSASPTNIG